MKGKKLLKTIDQNKLFLLFFSLFLSLLVIVGSTYSWITYSDEHINTSKPNRRKLSATIDEQFTMNLQWKPGEKVEKRVAVRNNGQTPAFVKLSLYEFFLAFEIDIDDETGNGALKQVAKSSTTPIKMDDPTTWAKGNTYKINTNSYFVANEVIKSNTQNIGTAYKYNGVRANTTLNYLTIQFNSTAIYTVDRRPEANQKNYWYYSNGYFYYSELLQPKEISSELIQSVMLDQNLPNRYKGSFYHLVPLMEAHDNTKSLLADWNLPPDSYEEAIYLKQVK